MGLNNSQSKGVFLSISNGKLVQQVKEKTDKTVTRTNKVGREVHELFYDTLTGFLVDVKTKESEYGKFWVFVFKDGDTYYNVETNYSSGYAVSFLKALPNADLSNVITIAPKLIIDGDKKNSVLFINQGGKGLKHYWTKDNPGELPQLKKIKVKGKDTWDDSDRLAYLEEYIKSNILAKIKPVLSDVTENEDAPF